MSDPILYEMHAEILRLHAAVLELTGLVLVYGTIICGCVLCLTVKALLNP